MVSNRLVNGNISTHPSQRTILERAPAPRPVPLSFRNDSLPVDTAPFSNRQFLDHLARLETPSNPNKTNADHDF
jgi:hypothetical protein